MISFYNKIENTKERIELIGTYNNRLLYDPIYNDFKMDKDFYYINYPPTTNYTDTILIVLCPKELRKMQNKHSLMNDDVITMLINPSISKRLLEALKINILKGKDIKLYLQESELNNYLFLIAIKLKGLYLTYIEDNLLYIQNKGFNKKIDLDKLNLKKLNDLIPDNNEDFKRLEIILT